MKPGDRVWIPASAGEVHEGTITLVESRRFKVTWDSPGRKPGESRVRCWYPRLSHQLHLGRSPS